jgi:hypothetical protein
LTTSAPSKLSCAIALTSARSAWARSTRGDMRREYMTLMPSSVGNSPMPTSASTQSVTSSEMTAPKIMTTLPTANGIGAIGDQAASTSAFALDSSEPVGCWWCQDRGSRRYRRMTARRYRACSRNCMEPAPSRRPNRPITLPRLTETIATAPSASALVVACPVASAGSATRPTTAPTTNAVAMVSKLNNVLPVTDTANNRGSSRIARPSTHRPLSRTLPLVKGNPR